MKQLKNLGSLARGKEAYACSSLGFRDERLITLEKVLEKYDELIFENSRDISLCGQFVMDLVDEINAKLNRLLESKRRLTLSYGLVTNFDTMADTRHWLKSKLFKALPRKESELLRERIEEMVDLLKALWLKIVNVEADFRLEAKKLMKGIADQFFDRLKKRCRKYRATDYDLWKARQPRLTMNRLTQYQAELTADMLVRGILTYDDRPHGEEMDGVDLGRLMKKLKNRRDLPDKFDEECAKLRRYSHWEDDRFVVDYQLLRNYIYRIFKLLTNEQRIAMFKYDVQLKQVHEDMKRMVEKEQIREAGDILASEVAMKYWRRLMEQGFVDHDRKLKPGTSRQQAMYIAEPFADILGLKNKWKRFEELWGIKNLAQEKWNFQQTGMMPARYQEIDKVFAD